MRAVTTVGLLCLLVLTGCGSEEEPEPRASTPAGFEVPDGVELTEADTTVELEEPATVVLDLGGGAASAVTVTVTSVKEGSVKKDFRFFTLPEESRKSTPYYVRASVTNEGPAGLGGVSLPLLAHTDADTVYPASELVGDFKPCPTSTIPTSFLTGDSADVCLVYLLPQDEELETVDLQPGEPSDAVRWAVD